jgi:hypothetical protein
MIKLILAVFFGTIVLAGCGTSSSDPGTVAAVGTVSQSSSSPAKVAAPKLTSSQKNAIRSAKVYLDMTGFSRLGLIKQLTQYDKYSDADATYAVDSLKTNYNEMAKRSAQNYLDFSGFSRSGMIKQLTSFDKYTEAQATYAADKVGL